MLERCSLLLVVFMLFTTVVVAQEEGWTTLTVGKSIYGIRYEENGAVIINNDLVMGCVPNTESAYETTLHVSRPSPLKKLVLVKCSGDETAESDEAYIIDTARNRVASRDIVPKHWRIINWVSWSPDERYALVAAAGEVTNGDMAFVDLQTNKVEEIHFKALTNNPRIKQDIMEEIQDFDSDGVSWISAVAFRLRLDVHCNPYQTGDETCFTKIIRSYPARVNLSPFSISYGNVGKASSPRARQRTSARVSQSGRGSRSIDSGSLANIRQIDFRNFTYSDVIHPPTEERIDIKVRNGKFIKGNQISYRDWDFVIKEIVYGDLTNDGKEDAIVNAVMTTYGSSNPASLDNSKLFLYTLENGKLISISSDLELSKSYSPNVQDDCDGWIDVVNIKSVTNGKMFVEAIVSSPSCFGKGYTGYKLAMSYKWNDSKFVLVGKPIKTRVRGR